ncbi:MAG: hypothetical protein MUE52_06020 [Tabrizicola sp.]|jgi:hypothetical protein|nr:hypothetical protein [Tabrizicola sp.]
MKRTPAKMIAEFHRLCDVFDALDDCAYLGYPDPERFGGCRWGPVPRQPALDRIADKTATPAQIVGGIREELNNMSLGLLDMLRRDPNRFRTILDTYRSRTGHDYFQDAGHPKKMLRVLLRRDRLTDEAEYRLLDTVLGDMSASLTETERQKGETLLATYRTRAE